MDNHTTRLKVCVKCGQQKPANDTFFHKCPTTKDKLRSKCKACTSEDKKAYRAENADFIKESRRRYTEANHEDILRRKREWHARNREINAAKRKIYYARNRDYLIAYQRQHKQKNPNYVKKLYVRYSSTGAPRVSHNNHRAKKLSLPATLTLKQWKDTLDYFKGCCAVCGRPSGFWHTLAQDHWIPISSPNCPGTVAANMIPLCHGDGGCNNSKKDKLPIEWLIGKFGKRKGMQIFNRIQAYLETLV